jgi:hypothetical protein
MYEYMYALCNIQIKALNISLTSHICHFIVAKSFEILPSRYFVFIIQYNIANHTLLWDRLSYLIVTLYQMTSLSLYLIFLNLPGLWLSLLYTWLCKIKYIRVHIWVG